MEQSLGICGYEALFKVVFVGDPGVGKRDVLHSCVPTTTKEVEGKPSMARAGVDFIIRCVEAAGKTFKLQLWDTASQEVLSPVYYRGAAGVVLVYDVTQETSFNGVERWVRDLREQTDASTVVLLVGTECHRKHLRAVSISDGEDCAARNGFLFAETSPPDPSRLQTAFTDFVARMYGKKEEFEASLAPASPANGEAAKGKKGRRRRKHRCILL